MCCGAPTLSGSHYFIRDTIGSVVGLVDQSGNFTTRYSYDPFGNTTVSLGPSHNTFQFTGRENDGTGLYFLRSRYYSPKLQRFISEDPLEFVDGPNRYLYVQDDPVNGIDLDGLATTVVFYPTGNTPILQSAQGMMETTGDFGRIQRPRIFERVRLRPGVELRMVLRMKARYPIAAGSREM